MSTLRGNPKQRQCSSTLKVAASVATLTTMDHTVYPFRAHLVAQEAAEPTAPSSDSIFTTTSSATSTEIHSALSAQNDPRKASTGITPNGFN